MKNVISIQYPDTSFDPDTVLEALARNTFFESPSWSVWPFLCALNDDETERNAIAEEDECAIKAMRLLILKAIQKKASSDFEDDARIGSVIAQCCTRNPQEAGEILKRSLVSFMTVFGLCMAATYARIFYGYGGPMNAFAAIWNKEIAFVAGMDAQFKTTYGTDGLIGKCPSELLNMFVKTTIAQVAMAGQKHASQGVADIGQWVSSGGLTEGILNDVNALFRESAADISAIIRQFFSQG